MTEFREQDLTGARFERVKLRGATMHRVDFTGAQIRGALFNGTRMRGVELVDVELTGELQNVVVNGVDIAPLVEGFDRREMVVECQNGVVAAPIGSQLREHGGQQRR